MKYERLTGRNEEPFYAFDACKECEHKDGCDKWCAYTVGAYTRLHELEDKIERGELVEVPKGAVVLTPEEREPRNEVERYGLDKKINKKEE